MYSFRKSLRVLPVLALVVSQVVLSPAVDALPIGTGIHLVRDIDLAGVGSDPSSFTEAGQNVLHRADRRAGRRALEDRWDVGRDEAGPRHP